VKHLKLSNFVFNLDPQLSKRLVVGLLFLTERILLASLMGTTHSVRVSAFPDSPNLQSLHSWEERASPICVCIGSDRSETKGLLADLNKKHVLKKIAVEAVELVGNFPFKMRKGESYP